MCDIVYTEKTHLCRKVLEQRETGKGLLHVAFKMSQQDAWNMAVTLVIKVI